MKNVLKFLGIFAVCWLVMCLIMMFGGAHSFREAVVTAVPVALVMAVLITAVAYFVGRIEKLEYTVKLLQHRVDELEKKD